MGDSPRSPRFTDLLISGLFGLTGLALLYLAAFEGKGWEHWAAGMALLILCGLAAIPEWRDSFGSSLRRVRVAFFPGTSLETGDGSREATALQHAEKPPESVLPKPVAQQLPVPGAVITANVLESLKAIDDALAHWQFAVDLIEKANFGSARDVLESAIERWPDHPKLLISAGYVSARLDDLPKAIEAARRAVAGARDKQEFREQYYVANANLCFYLAKRGNLKDKTTALEAGKLASDHADAFANRHSFKINYGYGLVQFAVTREELVAAAVFLAELRNRRLSDTEKAEVNRYLQTAVGRLIGLD